MKKQSLSFIKILGLLILLSAAVFIFNSATQTEAATLTNGMDASYVLGQTNFTSNGFDTDQTSLNRPGGTTYDSVGRRLFVADASNNRVLVFEESNGLTNGMDAAYVLGQSDFVSSVATVTDSGFATPRATAYYEDQQYLFVGDSSNSRVLVFDLSGGITNGMSASYVLGQSDFVSNESTTSQSGLDNIGGLALDQERGLLYVGDKSNNRVLVFDISTIVNGEAAINVIGQDDFTSISTSVDNASFEESTGVYYSPTQDYLYVSDSDRHRVLVFDVSTITDGEAAINVIGQDDFVSSSSGTDESSFNTTGGILLDDEDRLFVADAANNRVLVFNLSSGITNGMDASYVLGQTNFTSNGFGATQNSFFIPAVLDYDSLNKNLFVTDFFNNRILIFNLTPTPSSIPPKPLCTLTPTQSTITKGNSTTLTITPSGRGAEQTFYTQLQNDLSIRNKFQTEITVTPEETTTYNLAIVNARGANYCSTTVEVTEETTRPTDTQPTEQTETPTEQQPTPEQTTEQQPQTCSPYLTSYIKLNTDNNKEEVTKLEAFLNNNLNISLPLNGIYEKPDHEAVIRFQEQYSEDVLNFWGLKKGTGYVYKTTVEKINELVCSN